MPTHLAYIIIQCSYVLLCLSSDPTLTTENVTEVIKGVDYYSLDVVLEVSDVKRREIDHQYQSEEQRREALVAHAIHTHPCFSWKRLSAGLQRYRYHDAAAEVTRKYVKGQSVIYFLTKNYMYMDSSVSHRVRIKQGGVYYSH